MASGKALLGKALGRFIFRHATMTSVHEVSKHFRRVELGGEGLRKSGWMPGDKVQVFLPESGMRTYTPLRWDDERGATELLLYVHGDGPGSQWSQKLAAGDRCQFFGPRRSLVVRNDESVFLFGDETSFAVAHALKTSVRTGSLRGIFEVSQRSESDGVLRQMGLDERECIERAPGDAHLDLACESIRRELRIRPDTRVVLTGRAQSIQRIRAWLKDDGLRPPSTVKAYWSVGKKGLD